MSPAETTSRLRRLANEWRLGDEDLPQPDAKQITAAIYAAIEMIELQERIFDVIERTWYKQGLDIRGASLSYFMTDVHSALEKRK